MTWRRILRGAECVLAVERLNFVLTQSLRRHRKKQRRKPASSVTRFAARLSRARCEISPSLAFAEKDRAMAQFRSRLRSPTPRSRLPRQVHQLRQSRHGMACPPRRPQEATSARPHRVRSVVSSRLRVQLMNRLLGSLPLPSETPLAFRMLPEFLIEDITEFLSFTSK